MSPIRHRPILETQPCFSEGKEASLNATNCTVTQRHRTGGGRQRDFQRSGGRELKETGRMGGKVVR